MIYRDQESGVWMDKANGLSVARIIADKIMLELSMHHLDPVKQNTICSLIGDYVDDCLDEAHEQGVNDDKELTLHKYEPGSKVRVLGVITAVVRYVTAGPKGSISYRVLAIKDGRPWQDEFFEHELMLDEQDNEKAE